nr:hypothetical protein [uncultured Cupriavidus sp.]
MPATVDAALAYLAEALGHPVYAHWTLTRIKRRYGSLADAKAAQPTVLRLLLAHDGAVEYWERGRLRTAPADQAPSPETVFARLLHTHRRRFRSTTALPGSKTAVLTATEATEVAAAPWLAAFDHADPARLARANANGFSCNLRGRLRACPRTSTSSPCERSACPSWSCDPSLPTLQFASLSTRTRSPRLP